MARASLAAIAEPMRRRRRGLALPRRACLRGAHARLPLRGRPWYGPKRVEFSADAPADLRGHEEAFGCPVLFGCRADRLLFEPIDQPVATADALVARLCRHQLEQRAGAGAPPSWKR